MYIKKLKALASASELTLIECGLLHQARKLVEDVSSLHEVGQNLVNVLDETHFILGPLFDLLDALLNSVGHGRFELERPQELIHFLKAGARCLFGSLSDSPWFTST